MADADGITPGQLHWMIGFFEREEEKGTPLHPQLILEAIVTIYRQNTDESGDWDACQITEDIWTLLEVSSNLTHPTPEEA